ncbi:MAG TPA: hypothetical protein VN843_10840 [Anaerolineales bacterium]|nr:hypothetical protein [Anaerolineales bacterium]
MKSKFFSTLILFALLLSACGGLAPPFLLEVPASQTPPAPANTKLTGALLIWQSNDSPCTTAAFSVKSLSYGECGKTFTAVSPETVGYENRLSDLSGLFTSFTAETSAGSLILKGSGNLVPTDAEKRAIAEWAKLMFEIAQAGRAGAAWSLAFAWHREGGIAGFCDDVAMYLTGLVTTSDCKGLKAETYLTASQLGQLYAWVDGLKNIDYDDSNAPVADGMNITLVLNGNGQQQADEQTIRDILDFAGTMHAQLGYTAQAGPEVSDAQNALHDYLTALNTSNYVLGAELYGGDTSLLQTWNPDISNDLPALFERACSQNGLQCLAPRSITYRASEVDGHHFWVEFNNSDGTLFQQGPCCGETNGPVVSMFPFFVEKALNGSGYVVQELPPYVP